MDEGGQEKETEGVVTGVIDQLRGDLEELVPPVANVLQSLDFVVAQRSQALCPTLSAIGVRPSSYFYWCVMEFNSKSLRGDYPKVLCQCTFYN